MDPQYRKIRSRFESDQTFHNPSVAKLPIVKKPLDHLTLCVTVGMGAGWTFWRGNGDCIVGYIDASVARKCGGQRMVVVGAAKGITHFRDSVSSS